MFYVPLYLEGLRARPLLVFWLATLAQAAVWTLVPLVFYAAPPGALPEVLAVGHQLQLNGNFGPPLAYWLAEIAFRSAGLFGVYVLSQLCVIATYWCVFTLGRAIVGATHAAMAVLLMVGITVFTVPTPDFGPPILAMALWSAALLFYWRAAIENRREYWYALGGALALLLMTSDGALILFVALALVVAMTERGRAVARAPEPWIVLAGLIGFFCVHVYWLERSGIMLLPALARLRGAGMAFGNTTAWLRLVVALLLAHAGLAVLVVLASGWPRTRAQPAPPVVRAPAPPDAATFVGCLALVPALLATIVTVLAGARFPVGGAAPLLVLSGLAVVVAAGRNVELHHQRILGYAWVGLLLVPALFIPTVIAVLPWTTGTELQVAQPASAMGRYFGDSFARRTGRSLAVVSGDEHLAELIALAAPSRPSVYFAADPGRSPWVSARDIRDKGAVIVWTAHGTNPTPPPEIKSRFPDLVPEVPHTFSRPVRGRQPPLLIGWGVIRPAAAPVAASPAAVSPPVSATH
ncbi:MAG: glycosyltransferase family 39 protein [Hyphomicrobiales bacterium]|nr:glycosyltransferase family 39 protein [Hyphomicrobiales bacterium]